MNDPRFHLDESDAGERPARKARARSIVLVSLLALTLVLGAFYAPLLFDTQQVAAGPARQDVTVPAVPVMQASLVQDQDALANLFDAIGPSVVSIEVAVNPANMTIPGFPQGGLPEGLPDNLIPNAQGSGWIFDNNGHIVTNNHVVENAEQVTVVFYDGTWAEAEVVATDPQADLAVLRVDPPAGFPWRPLVLSQEEPRVGHSVVAIGNPFGLASTMTTGIVSALGRSYPVGGLGENRYTLPDIIQTDAAINPGNSGGPLVNLNGEVVGVNFAIESGSGSNSGVGFAIPVSIVERIVPALIADGSYTYPYLGLSGTSVTPTLARELELGNTQLGAYVATVIPGGPAAEAGIQAADADTNKGGDLIVSFNGQTVRSFDELVAELVTTTKPGDTAALGIIRDGKEMTVDVTVGQRPTAAQAGQTQQSQEEGEVSARRALAIAEDAVKGDLGGDITSRTATPDTRDGRDVWVVELATDSQQATVVIDRSSGEIVELTIE